MGVNLGNAAWRQNNGGFLLNTKGLLFGSIVAFAAALFLVLLIVVFRGVGDDVGEVVERSEEISGEASITAATPSATSTMATVVLADSTDTPLVDAVVKIRTFSVTPTSGSAELERATTQTPTPTQTPTSTPLPTATLEPTVTPLPTVPQEPTATPPTVAAISTPEQGDGETMVEVSVGIEIPPLGPRPIDPTVTLSGTAAIMDASQIDGCHELTGYCRQLEYQPPIQISIPCLDKRVELTEVRDTGETVVGMCSPRISIVSEAKIASLHEIEESLNAIAALDETIKRGGLLARVVSIDRGPVPGDSFCGVLPETIDCVNVGLEITNLGADPWTFDDDDFDVTGFDKTLYSEFDAGVPNVRYKRRGYVLQSGERLLANIPRRVPRAPKELRLDYLGQISMKFSLRRGEEWESEPDEVAGNADVRNKVVLEHLINCGFDYLYVDRYTRDVAGATLGYVDEVARCDPNAVTVLKEDLEVLRGEPNSDFGRVSDPIPFRETYKDTSQSLRVVAVARGEEGERCGKGYAPEGYVCVAVEFEVTNLQASDGRLNQPYTREIWYSNPRFELIGTSGVAYSDGASDPGVSPYGEDYIKVYPEKRLTTRVVRYVHSDDEAEFLVYSDRNRQLAFRLVEDLPSDTPSDAMESRVLIGSAGGSQIFAAPIGTSVYVHGFAITVLEFERGWIPTEECCNDILSEVLLKSTTGDFMATMDRETANELLARQGTSFDEYDGESEYVRVSVEAKNVGSLGSASTFNTAHMFLIDDDRRIYPSGFYPNPERHLTDEGGAIWSQSAFRRWRQSDRTARVYGGGRVSEDLVWLVPADAWGLKLVYLPYDFEAGGFLALEPLVPPRDTLDSPNATSVEGGLRRESTSPTRPAPFGTRVIAEDGVVLHVSEVEHLASPCSTWYPPIEGGECLSVTVELEIPPSAYIRGVFGLLDIGFDRESFSFLIDGEEITVQRRHEGGSINPLLPTFSSVLDWAEINGRGKMKVSYQAEVRAGWTNGMLVFHPDAWVPEAYLSINEVGNDSAGTTATDLRQDDEITGGSSDGIGVYEYLQEREVSLAAEVGSYVGEFAIACGTHSVRPYYQNREWVYSVVQDLIQVDVGDAARVYKINEGDIAEQCARAFPPSSKALVLNHLLGVARFNCENRHTGVDDASLSAAVRMSEVFFDYLGGGSPVSMSDFSDVSGLCEWMVNPIGEGFAEFVDGAGLSAMFTDELVAPSQFREITQLASQRGLW